MEPELNMDLIRTAFASLSDPSKDEVAQALRCQIADEPDDGDPQPPTPPNQGAGQQ